jgi:sec-independent protein translocase protein TatA
MPFNIGPGELIVILLIALVVLGPGKLPDVASSLGKSVREFRRAASDLADAGKVDNPTAGPAAQAQATTPAAPAVAPEAPAQTSPAAPDAPPAEPTEPASDPNRS